MGRRRPCPEVHRSYSQERDPVVSYRPCCYTSVIMRRSTALLVFVLILTLFALACGGDAEGPNRVLQLGFVSLTEDEFRSSFRELDRTRNNPIAGIPGIASLCNQVVLEEIEAVAILDALRDLGLGQGTVPRTDPVPADVTRAAEIVDEECERRRNI